MKLLHAQFYDSRVFSRCSEDNTNYVVIELNRALPKTMDENLKELDPKVCMDNVIGNPVSGMYLCVSDYPIEKASYMPEAIVSLRLRNGRHKVWYMYLLN